MKKFLLIFCVAFLFFCRYEVWFSFLPTTTLRICQILGLGYTLLKFNKLKNHFPKKLLHISLLCLLFAVYAVYVSMQYECNFVMFRFISNLIFFLCTSYCILSIMLKVYKRIDLGCIFDIWLYTSIIQLLISLLFFTNHGVYDFFNSIQKLSEGMNSREDLVAVRIIGLGNAFFGAGFNYGIDLLVLTLLPYVDGSKLYHKQFLYWLTLLGVLFVGIFSARTFWVACMCSLGLVIYYHRTRLILLLRKSIVFVAVVVFAFYGVLSFISCYVENMQNILLWAFEMFENYFSSGTMETSSSDKMFAMYVFPTNLCTWLFGDGIINNADGSYYMYTDIGFIRLIFFWGVILTVLFYLYRLYIVKSMFSYSHNKALNICMLTYVGFELICNFKGLVCGDVFLSWVLIYLLFFQKRKSII